MASVIHRPSPISSPSQAMPKAAAAQWRQFAAVKVRQHDRAPRMPCRRRNQRVQRSCGRDFVASAQHFDHPLNMTAALARVLDEVEILVATDLLDADEHWASPGFPQKTPQHIVLCIKLFR